MTDPKKVEHEGFLQYGGGGVEDISTSYPDARRSLLDFRKDGFDMWQALAARLAPRVNQGASLIDVGTSNALFLREVHKAAPGHGRLLGVDIHPTPLEIAELLMEGTEYEKAIELAVVPSKGPLPFEDNEFDTASVNFVGYHVPYPEPFFREVSRIVAPGGLIAAATRNTEHQNEVWEDAKIAAEAQEAHQPVSYYAHFDGAKADELFGKLFTIKDFIEDESYSEIPFTRDGWLRYAQAVLSTWPHMEISPGQLASGEQTIKVIEDLIMKRFTARATENGAHFKVRISQKGYILLNNKK